MRFLKPALALISIAAIVSGCNNQIKKVDLKTEADSLSYAIGINMGYNLKNNKISDVNTLALANGIQDVNSDKKDIMTPEKSMELIQKFLQKQRQAEGLKNLEAGKKFLEENAKKEGVITDPSGLQYKIVEEGTGEYPKETDMVRVHYKGTFLDGSEFDSSFKRNAPVEFSLGGVIRGWTIGLQKVKVGGKIILWVPSELAYGETGNGPIIAPNQTLVFEVQLLDIVKQENKK